MYESDSDPRPSRRISVSEARQTLSDILNTVAYGNQRVIVARHGRDLVAIVPVADLRRLESTGEQATVNPTLARARPGPRA